MGRSIAIANGVLMALDQNTTNIDPDFGRDISCGVDLDPLLRDVTGVEAVMQAMLRRLITRPGTLVGCPLYGFGLLDLLNADLDDSEIQQLAARMGPELEKDERVFSASARQTRSADGETIAFAVVGNSALGPFEFVLDASAAGAKIRRDTDG